MPLNNLYQQVIMKHYKAPHGFKELPDACPVAERENTSCGDHFKLVLTTEGESISDIALEGSGCAISTAACSLMVERMIGKSITDAKETATAFKHAMKQRTPLDQTVWGDMTALDAVKKYRGRITCATLCWDLLLDAIQQTTSET